VLTRVIPYGHRPDCVSCGECFSNWNRILDELQVNTTLRVEEARKVKMTGAAGVYSPIFQKMEDQIAEVNNIIDQSSLKNEELTSFTNDIRGIEERLANTNQRNKDLDNNLAEIETSIVQGQYNLTALRQNADRVMNQARNIKDKATQLQEANVGGALTLTQQAAEKSMKAKQKVDSIAEERDGSKLYESEKTRRSTKKMMDDKRDTLTNSTRDNTEDLNEVKNEIDKLKTEFLV